MTKNRFGGLVSFSRVGLVKVVLRARLWNKKLIVCKILLMLGATAYRSATRHCEIQFNAVRRTNFKICKITAGPKVLGLELFKNKLEIKNNVHFR